MKKKYYKRKGKDRYTKKDLIEAVKTSQSKRQVLIKLGLAPAGGNYETLNKNIAKYGLDTSHFLGQCWREGQKGPLQEPEPLKTILVKNRHFTSSRLRKRLISEGLKSRKCEHCGRVTWQKQPIPLELNHINGNKWDNRLENLEILCPNCHALTPNYRGKNIGNGNLAQE